MEIFSLPAEFSLLQSIFYSHNSEVSSNYLVNNFRDLFFQAEITIFLKLQNIDIVSNPLILFSLAGTQILHYLIFDRKKICFINHCHTCFLIIFHRLTWNFKSLLSIDYAVSRYM